MKNQNLKKYAIKSLWIIVSIFISFVEIYVLTIAVDAWFFEFIGQTLFYPLDIVSNFGHVGMLAILFFILLYKLYDLNLYIWAYKIYTGKNNWYKFFRDREKQQKLQNKLDWQNQIKG